MPERPTAAVAEALEYLSGLGVVLWPAVAFDLTDERQRIMAAHWLAEQRSEQR